MPDLKNNRLEVIAYTEDKELKVTAIADNGTSEVARTEGNSNMSFTCLSGNPVYGVQMILSCMV